MILDYKITVNSQNNLLEFEVIKQDERFWNDSFYTNNTYIYEYMCKNGFKICSKSNVSLYKDKMSIYLKGDDSGSCARIKFETMKELISYQNKLVEALEEFKTWELEVK